MQAVNETPAPVNPTPPVLLPYEWVCLDIETSNGRPEAVERWVRQTWLPDKRWKEETIGQRYKDVCKKRAEKLSLIDESPIVVISMRSDRDLRCLHTGYVHEPREVHGGLVEGFATTKDMLVAFRNLCDAFVGPDTTWVGHNVRDLYLKRLRWWLVHEGVRPPTALTSPDQSVYDTMHEFCRRYSLKKDIMVALDDVLDDFGLESHKGIVDGSKIPELWEAGEYDTVVQYGMLDVLAESELFLRMTGLLVGLA